MSTKKTTNPDSGKELTKVLKRLRSKSEQAPSLAEITREVEIVRSKSKKKLDRATKEKYMKAVRQAKGMLKGGGSLIETLMKEKKRELKAEERKYKLLYGK